MTDYVSYEHFEHVVHELRREIEQVRRSARHVQIEGPVTVVMQAQSGPATTAILTIGVNTMPGAITVDTTNETALVSFKDDHGNATAEPSGAVATFASDNDAVATVAADANNPLQADITPVGLGTANISVTFNGTALEADGTTAIADPSAVAVTVSAGAAAEESFVLSA